MERNLLAETLDALAKHGKTPSDVWYCGSPGFGQFSFEKFRVLADIWYDAGYGAQQVCSDLLVVGVGWWLERHEYDGREWWEFRQTPRLWEPRNPTTLFVWPHVEDDTLKAANDGIEEWYKSRVRDAKSHSDGLPEAAT